MSDKQVTKVERYGLSLLENLHVTHEQILERIDGEKIKELGEMAMQGQTLHEMANALNVSFGEFILARAKSDDFDQFCQKLETIAAGVHLQSARTGIKNPKDFSPAAYDRVMGALGFTPHVSHVQVQGGAAQNDAAADRDGKLRVGFDVAAFMGKHEESAPIIDITASDSSDSPEIIEPETTDEPEDWEDLM